jgi:hypothetical protein
MWNDFVSYRVYADGTVVHEDEFDEWDNGSPYYDDYGEYRIPVALEEHLVGNMGFLSHEEGSNEA